MGSYKVVGRKEAVLVKVAKESGFMEKKPGFIAENGQKVDPHWANGKPLTNGNFLNVFFYGILRENLGRSVVATVEVVEKTTETGRTFTIINVKHTPDVEPTHDLKFPFANEGVDGYAILHSDQVVEFRERVKTPQ